MDGRLLERAERAQLALTSRAVAGTAVFAGKMGCMPSDTEPLEAVPVDELPADVRAAAGDGGRVFRL